MAFPETTKIEAKQRSRYACVWCQRTDLFIEVHHIIPQEENGPETIDNAAPLCPNCHTMIGSSTETRKQLLERRNWWWRYCATLKTSLPNEDTARKLDELVSSLRSIEAQGGRNEAVLTEIKGRVLGQLQAQVMALSSSSTATEVVSAMQPHEPTVYQLTATVTFTGTGRHEGMPDPYHSYFVVASTGVVSGPTGATQSGAIVTVIPVAGDDAGPEQQLFAPGGTPEDGMQLALRTLRSLPQNQALKETFYPREKRAI